jgi:glycosyltransferase involved in cell wall biosynthesis
MIAATRSTRRRQRVCVVGSGDRFVSGLSYYTHRLSAELAADHEVSAVLMRQLLPTRFYPGRERVGTDIVKFNYSPQVDVFNGVDWYWIPSIWRALAFLRRHRPNIVLFQWWTGTVLHSYVALAAAAKSVGAKVVVEFHETLDTGELQVPLVARYVKTVAPALFRLTDGFVVHSTFDLREVTRRYSIAQQPVSVIHHGPYDQYAKAAAPERAPARPAAVCNLLYFGVIRPFKGVEDIVRAFNGLTEEEARSYTLTIVGETWESWTLPAALVDASPHRSRIRFVNRYVSDREVPTYFEAADAVILPYRRSSASGPLHIAMSYGLPVLVTGVGGLREAAGDYAGVIPILPADPESIRQQLPRVRELAGRRFTDPHSWIRTISRYDTLFDQVLHRGGSTEAEPQLL